MFSVKQPYQPKPKPKPAYRPPPPGNNYISSCLISKNKSCSIFKNQSDVNLAFIFGNHHKEIRSESLLIEVLLI